MAITYNLQLCAKSLVMPTLDHTGTKQWKMEAEDTRHPTRLQLKHIDKRTFVNKCGSIKMATCGAESRAMVP